jgi:hypothetical protein
MDARLTNPAFADLRAVRALVASSAIVLKKVAQPEPIFSDWEKERRSGDVDALILAWIASHVPGAAHRSRFH